LSNSGRAEKWSNSDKWHIKTFEIEVKRFLGFLFDPLGRGVMAGRIDGNFLGTLLPDGTKRMSRWFGLGWLPVLCALAAVPIGAMAAVQDGPAELFRAGKQAMQSGQLAVAEADFRKVIALDPKSGAAHVNLGVVYMRERRWDDAVAELRVAQGFLPQEPGIRLNIGLAYYRKSDFTAAIEPFQSVLKSTPDSQQARYLLGLCYFFVNRYKDAAETLAPLWEGESGHLNYLYVLSIAASKASDKVLQKRAFDQMLAIGQNSPEFHLYLGKAWLAEDNTGKALDEFHLAAEGRSDLPLVHYFLGRTYLERHAYPEAEAELERDIAIEPDLAYNYEDLGILSALLEQPDKAEAYFRQAIERNGTLVNSYFGLAKLYRDSSRYREALEMIDRAIALAPKSASLHFTRGQVLAKLGHAKQARVEFDRAAELLKSFNDWLQQDRSADNSADAQFAAQE
jgi:tetratricopeptide (TPR) repeat protein